MFAHKCTYISAHIHAHVHAFYVGVHVVALSKRIAHTIRVQMPFYMHNNFLFVFALYLACMCVCNYISLAGVGVAANCQLRQFGFGCAHSVSHIIQFRVQCALINPIGTGKSAESTHTHIYMYICKYVHMHVYMRYAHFSPAAANSSALLGAHFHVFVYIFQTVYLAKC